MHEHENRAKQIKANLLTDSGTYRTLLTEEQWRQMQPEGANRMLELGESMVGMVTYGTNKTPEVLGRAKCQIKAGVEVTTLTDVIRGAQESLDELLRDRETLGTRKIQPEGDTVKHQS